MKYFFFLLALVAFFAFTSCTVTTNPNGPGVITRTTVEDIDTVTTPETAPGTLCATGGRSPHDVLLRMKSTPTVENHEVDCIATGNEIIQAGYVWPWYRSIYWNEYCMPVWLLVLLLATLAYLLYRLLRNNNRNEDNRRGSSHGGQSPTPDRYGVRNTPAIIADDVEDAPPAKSAPPAKPCKDYTKALSQAIAVAGKKGAVLDFADGGVTLYLDTTEPTPATKKVAAKKPPVAPVVTPTIPEKPAIPAEDQQG